MLRIALLLFSLVGTTLAGIAILIVVSTPQLATADTRLIPIAAAIGFLLGVPVSLAVARAIVGKPASAQ